MNKTTNPYGELIVKREEPDKYMVASGVWYMITDGQHHPLNPASTTRGPDLRVMQRGIDHESLFRMMHPSRKRE